MFVDGAGGGGSHTWSDWLLSERWSEEISAAEDDGDNRVSSVDPHT